MKKDQAVRKTGKAPFFMEPFFALLWGMMILGCLLIFHNYIFGNETLVFDDIGSDTRQQYLMLYNSLVNHIRSGNLAFWDFTNGLGANAFVIQLTHPLLLFVYLGGVLLGPEHLAGLMIYYYMAEICLAGSFCYLYLSGYRLSGPCKMTASFLYAFNGYLLIWGQHYQLGSIVVLLPLLYYFIDELIRAWRRVTDRLPSEKQSRETRKKYLALRLRPALGIAATGGIILLNGYYQGYMSFLAAAIYVCIRVFITEELPVKQRMCLLLAQAAGMGAGLVLGMLNLLPSFSLIFSSSSRMDSGGTSSLTALGQGIRRNLSLWPRSYYKDLGYRFFGNNLQGTPVTHMGRENYYEQINLFFSALLFILLIQFFFTLRAQEGTLRQKIARVLGVLLIVFSVTVKLGSYVFNGFAYAFERHTFLFMPFFALLCGWMLGQIMEKRILSRTGLVLAGIGLVMIYGRAYQINPAPECRMNAAILLLTGLGVTAVLLVSGRQNHAAASGFKSGACRICAADVSRRRAFRNVRSDSKDLRAGYNGGFPCAAGILAVLLFLHVVSDAGLGFAGRWSVKKDDSDYFEKTYHSDVTEALDWIDAREDSFYRVEKTFSTAAAYMESCAQGYYGVSTYNSVQNRNIQNFVEGLWPGLLTGYDNNHYLFANDLTNTQMAALTGVKYLLSDRDDLSLDGWQRYHQAGTVTIYRNQAACGLGTVYRTVITEEEFQNRPENVDVPALLQEVLIVNESSLTQEENGTEWDQNSLTRQQELSDLWDRYRLTEKEGTGDTPEEGFTWKGEEIRIAFPGMTAPGSSGTREPAGEKLSAAQAGGPAAVGTAPSGAALADADRIVVMRVSADRPALIHVKVEAGAETVLFNNGNRASRFRLRMPSAASDLTLYADDPQAVLRMEEIHFYTSESGYRNRAGAWISETEEETEGSSLQMSEIRIEKPVRDDRLTGRISAAEDGTVLLTIPYEKGWEIYLDDAPAEPVRGDYGFLAFQVPAGAHTLNITFHAPGLKAGAWLSGAGWLIWLLLLVCLVIDTDGAKC